MGAAAANAGTAGSGAGLAGPSARRGARCRKRWPSRRCWRRWRWPMSPGLPKRTCCSCTARRNSNSPAITPRCGRGFTARPGSRSRSGRGPTAASRRSIRCAKSPRGAHSSPPARWISWCAPPRACRCCCWRRSSSRAARRSITAPRTTLPRRPRSPRPGSGGCRRATSSTSSSPPRCAPKASIRPS